MRNILALCSLLLLCFCKWALAADVVLPFPGSSTMEREVVPLCQGKLFYSETLAAAKQAAVQEPPPSQLLGKEAPDTTGKPVLAIGLRDSDSTRMLQVPENGSALLTRYGEPLPVGTIPSRGHLAEVVWEDEAHLVVLSGVVAETVTEGIDGSGQRRLFYNMSVVPPRFVAERMAVAYFGKLEVCDKSGDCAVSPATYRVACDTRNG